MHSVTKSISMEIETGQKILKWMQRNGVDNFSFAVNHLIKAGLGSRNNGVGVVQKKLVLGISKDFEEVLEEQGLKTPTVMKK